MSKQLRQASRVVLPVLQKKLTPEAFVKVSEALYEELHAHDLQVGPGDLVRSFDFESRDTEGERACYCEGVIEEIVQGPDCRRYRIRVTRRVFGGKELTDDCVESEVLPPINGTPKAFGGVCDGVERIVP